MSKLKTALKGRPEYSYTVDGVQLKTREAARIVQRTLRNTETGIAPRILQTKTVTEVIR